MSSMTTSVEQAKRDHRNADEVVVGLRTAVDCLIAARSKGWADVNGLTEGAVHALVTAIADASNAGDRWRNLCNTCAAETEDDGDGEVHMTTDPQEENQ